MSIITYPLNGVVYSAEDVGIYLCTRTSGVYSKESNFAVSITGTRQITIAPGLAWINYDDFKGVAVCSREENILTVPDADNTLNRVDRVVLQFDTSENITAIKLKTGTPAVAAQPPNILQNHNQYELGLCTISVPAGSSAVTIADITDTRADEAVCGVMRDGVTGIPTAQLQAQIAALLAQLRQSITNVDKQGFYSKEEVDALLDALQEQVKSAAGAAAKPVPVWTGEVVPNGSGGGVTQTLQLPGDVDYLELKITTSDHGAVYRLLPGNTVYPFNQYCPFVLSTDKVLSYRGHNADASRTYLTGYHYETFSDGVKIPQVVGFRDASNSYNNSTFTVDDSVDYIAAQWVSASTADSVTVRDSSSLIRLRGSYSYLFNFATDGTITLYGSKNVGAYTIKFTFYHYATPEELAAQQTATQSAQADTDAMTVDQEYRIALLELGITDETT